jgi:purine-binding chemotaxis protein CheW
VIQQRVTELLDVRRAILAADPRFDAVDAAADGYGDYQEYQEYRSTRVTRTSRAAHGGGVTATMNSRQYATFEVDDQLFGVPVAIVQEVPELLRVHAGAAGAQGRRGTVQPARQVIAAVDLRVQLGPAARDLDGPAMNVIVRTEDESVSLLVDRIGEVVDLHEDAFEPPPDTLHGPTRELINGAFKLDGRLMLALDTARRDRHRTGPATQE